MSEGRYNFYDEDVKVNLVDIIFYLLRHWRSLIGAILVGVLLGSGIYIWKNPVKEIEIKENGGLLEGDYVPDEELMDLAYGYRMMFDRQRQYSKDSIFMRVDPIEAYTGKLEYYVKAGENTRLISELLENILDDQSVLKEMKRAGSLDCDLRYLREILDCSLEKDSNFDVQVNGEEGAAAGLCDSVSMMVKYTILYTDARVCQAMLRVLGEKVSALNEQLQEQYGEFELIKTKDMVQCSVDGALLNEQRNRMELERTFFTNRVNMESGFTDKDWEYYVKVYIEAANEERKIDDAVLEMPDRKSSAKEMIKWLIIGMFLTCVCWGGCYFIKYLLDTHLKSIQELKDTYGLQMLGRTELSSGKEKGIDGLLCLVNRRRKGHMDSVQYIAMSIKTLRSDSILLCLNPKIEELRLLADEVKKYSKEIIMGDMVHESCEALETAKRAEGIVMAVAVEKTTHEEIKRSLDVCRLQKIPVLGVVVVEKM